MTPNQIAELMALTGSTDVAQVKPPPGCVRAVEHERRFTRTAKLLDDLVKKLATKKQIDPSAIAKLAAEATKARRAASQLAMERENAERIERLRRHEADLKRGAH